MRSGPALLHFEFCRSDASGFYAHSVTFNDVRYHDWSIDPRQYARQEDRRGRRFAYEQLDAGRTALVVVDMVPFFVEESPYCRGIVENVVRLSEVIREMGGTVAWVIPAATAEPSAWAIEFYGERIANLFNSSGGAGSFSERLWSGFNIQPDDLTVEKTSSSAFFPGRCTLGEELTTLAIENVIVTGTVTDVCCAATARDAATLGFRTVMVADANAGRDDTSHNATLETFYRTFGDVRTTNEVAAVLRAGNRERQR